MMIASRRPLFHFAPDHGWMNDPNGPIRRADGWHLFYQKATDAPDFRTLDWGHAISDDLLVWHDLGVAIPANDRGYVYSGCTVTDPADPARMLAFFTRHHPDGTSQTQERAVSCDGGLTWDCDPDDALIDEGLARFRDPFLVQLDDGSWRMLTVKPVAWHGWQEGRSSIAVYASTDLRRWTPVGDLGVHGETGEIFEVPVLVRVPVETGSGINEKWRWLLIVSVIDRAGDGVVCRTTGWIGSFDGARFTPEDEAFPIDHGPDYYAATAFAGLSRDDVVLIAWLNSWRYARETPSDAPIGGTQSLPRRLTLARKGAGRLRLEQRPAADPASLALADVRLDVALERGTAETLPFRSTCFVARLRVQFDQATRVTLALRAGPEAVTAIILDRLAGIVSLDRSLPGKTSIDGVFAGTWRAPLVLDDGGVSLTILADRTSIELFIGDGDATLTAQVFPPAGHDAALVSADGSASISGDLALLDGAAF